VLPRQQDLLEKNIRKRSLNTEPIDYPEVAGHKLDDSPQNLSSHFTKPVVTYLMIRELVICVVARDDISPCFKASQCHIDQPSLINLRWFPSILIHHWPIAKVMVHNPMSVGRLSSS